MSATAAARPAQTGAVLFARYAYPPNALGYCGPDDPAALYHAAGAGQVAELEHLARRFEGAWPYLELIAGANGIDDPLDRRVVEAYWVGNALTRRVAPRAAAASLSRRFERRAGRHFSPLVEAAMTGGLVQHSFHVFAVYPWLGLLRAGKEGPPLEVLDRCRIRWGRVEALEGDTAIVRSRALSFAGSRLVLDVEAPELVRRSRDGEGLVELAVGDVVSLHWDWVCDRLSTRALAGLKASTRRNLEVANALSAPGPAVICNA